MRKRTLAACCALSAAFLSQAANASSSSHEHDGESSSSSSEIRREAERLTRDWAERYGLDEDEARSQRHYTEEGLAKVSRLKDDVADPYDFKWTLVGIPKDSLRKAIVLRSNQPAPENLVELTQAAKKVGIAPSEILVINLRIENNVEARYVEHAKTQDDERLKAMGEIRTLYLPAIDHTIGTQDQIKQILAAAMDPKNKLVVIHCAAGRARTGTDVAAIRVALDGWSTDRALAEGKELGLSRLLQKKFVRTHADEWRLWAQAQASAGELR